MAQDVHANPYPLTTATLCGEPGPVTDDDAALTCGHCKLLRQDDRALAEHAKAHKRVSEKLAPLLLTEPNLAVYLGDAEAMIQEAKDETGPSIIEVVSSELDGSRDIDSDEEGKDGEIDVLEQRIGSMLRGAILLLCGVEDARKRLERLRRPPAPKRDKPSPQISLFGEKGRVS